MTLCFHDDSFENFLLWSLVTMIVIMFPWLLYSKDIGDDLSNKGGPDTRIVSLSSFLMTDEIRFFLQTFNYRLSLLFIKTLLFDLWKVSIYDLRGTSILFLRIITFLLASIDNHALVCDSFSQSNFYISYHWKYIIFAHLFARHETYYNKNLLMMDWHHIAIKFV